jgi:hypothetical protein
LAADPTFLHPDAARHAVRFRVAGDVALYVDSGGHLVDNEQVAGCPVCARLRSLLR